MLPLLQPGDVATVRVEGIDHTGRHVHLQNGETLDYDHLVLATGSAPRHLPEAIGGTLPGVLAVRTLADVDAMEPEFAPGRRLLIVGGGLSLLWFGRAPA